VAGSSEAALVSAALARNDRFLVEIVEAHGICPFARGTRTSGRLHREVVLSTNVAVLTERVGALDAVEADIALLLLPTFSGDPRALERLITEVRAADETRRPPPFALAPFHPETPFDTTTPSRLVGLFRRSPDPTIQLVRFAALDAARRRAPDGKFFFDGSAAAWAALAARPERGLSEQISHDNFERLREAAPALAQRLHNLRGQD